MQQPVFILKVYDEAMSLIVETRNYIAFVEARRRQSLDEMTSLRASCEALRVTSRLIQVMAWLMMQRAVHNGEISHEEALSDRNRLSGEVFCLDDAFAEDESLPGGLRSLLDRSYRLYVRTIRLERQMVLAGVKSP